MLTWECDDLYHIYDQGYVLVTSLLPITSPVSKFVQYTDLLAFQGYMYICMIYTCTNTAHADLKPVKQVVSCRR